jgi:hypothetical protein
MQRSHVASLSPHSQACEDGGPRTSRFSVHRELFSERNLSRAVYRLRAPLPMALAPIPGAPVPLVALAPPAVQHIFTRCNIVGQDNTMDFVHVDKTAQMVTAFPSMWVDASSVVAGHVAAPFLMVSALACPAAHADWDDPTITTFLSTSSELTTRFTLGFTGTCADTVAALGLFDKTYSSTLDYLAALPEELPRVPNPSPFEFKTTDMETPTLFLTGAVRGRPAVAAVPGVPAVRAAGGRPRVPAVPAVPAIPAILAVPGAGPPDLVWWNMICLAHSLDRASPLPLASFLRRGMVALDRCSALARADATSRVCSANDILRAYLLAQLPAASSDASVARLFRRSHDRLRALPSPLRSGSLDPDVLELELADDLAWLTPEKQDGITAQRLIHIKSSYDAVYDPYHAIT